VTEVRVTGLLMVDEAALLDRMRSVVPTESVASRIPTMSPRRKMSGKERGFSMTKCDLSHDIQAVQEGADTVACVQSRSRDISPFGRSVTGACVHVKPMHWTSSAHLLPTPLVWSSGLVRHSERSVRRSKELSIHRHSREKNR
jgi:hypothetical protein